MDGAWVMVVDHESTTAEIYTFWHKLGLHGDLPIWPVTLIAHSKPWLSVLTIAAIVAGATLGAHCAARPRMTAAGSVITAPMSLTQGDCPAAPYFPNGIWVPLPAPHRRHEERS